MGRLAGDHVVERHRDIGTERPLDLHGALGRQGPIGAVHMTLKLDPVLADPPETLEREDLEPAGVGEHRARPGGEPVQAAHVADDVLAGTQVQMIRVAEDDLGAGAADVLGAESADDTVGADRHEGRRLHRAVRQGEGARSRGSLGGVESKLEHQRGRIAIDGVILSGAKDRVGGASEPRASLT